MFLVDQEAEVEEVLLPPPRVRVLENVVEISTPASPEYLHRPGSPGEIESDVDLDLVSSSNQEEIRQKLGEDLQAAISDGIFAIYSDNDMKYDLDETDVVDLNNISDQTAESTVGPGKAQEPAPDATTIIKLDTKVDLKEPLDLQISDHATPDLLETAENDYQIENEGSLDVLPPPAQFEDLGVSTAESSVKLNDFEFPSGFILSADKSDSTSINGDSVGALSFEEPEISLNTHMSSEDQCFVDEMELEIEAMLKSSNPDLGFEIETEVELQHNVHGPDPGFEIETEVELESYVAPPDPGFEIETEVELEPYVATPDLGFEIETEVELEPYVAPPDLGFEIETEVELQHNVHPPDPGFEIETEVKLESNVAPPDLGFEIETEVELESNVLTPDPGFEIDTEVELEHNVELPDPGFDSVDYELSSDEIDEFALVKMSRNLALETSPAAAFKIPDEESSSNSDNASVNFEAEDSSIDLNLSQAEIETEKEFSEYEIFAKQIVEEKFVELEFPDEKYASLDLQLAKNTYELTSDRQTDEEVGSSIKVGFSSQSSYDADLTMPSDSEREYSVDSTGSSSKVSYDKRGSVAETSQNKASISSKSKGFGSVISGGDEISIASSERKKSMSEDFPLFDARQVALTARLNEMSDQYEHYKEAFRKYIVKSDVEWTSVPFLKCCLFMRNYLLSAFFQIVGSGEHVLFDDLIPPTNNKKASTKKKLKAVVKMDPILAQLPNTLSMKQDAHKVSVSKKFVQRQKSVANTAITMYTSIVQSYDNYKTLFVAVNETYDGTFSRLSEYSNVMETMQNEIMMATMILTGLCMPD